MVDHLAGEVTIVRNRCVLSVRLLSLSLNAQQANLLAMVVNQRREKRRGAARVVRNS